MRIPSPRPFECAEERLDAAGQLGDLELRPPLPAELARREAGSRDKRVVPPLPIELKAVSPSGTRPKQGLRPGLGSNP